MALTFEEYKEKFITDPNLPHAEAVDAWSQYLLQQNKPTKPEEGGAWFGNFAENLESAITEQGITKPPTVEEQVLGVPEVPTVTAPPLKPLPAVTAAPVVEAPVVPTMPGVTPTPTIAKPTVEAAPEFQPIAEEAEMAAIYGGEIRDILAAKGRGLDQETQDLMIRKSTQVLMATEDEKMRLMANDMERRGITNSGLVFWNEQKIKSATTTAIANSITDIQISSALMKISSFENALGHAGQFLGYLQEQSKLVYTGKMATWEARTQASLIQYQAQINADMEGWKMTNQYNLAGWQANTQALFAKWEMNSTASIEKWRLDNQFSLEEWGTQANYNLAEFQVQSAATLAQWSAQADIYKLGVNQAYAQDNMLLAGQIAEQAVATEFENNKILLEMELEAANQQAAATGFGQLIGTTVGGILKL